MNELLEQFLLESRELVEMATRDLLTLERDPEERETLDRAFRAFHTLKGGAAIVDFDPMTRAVHAAENVLSATRAGTRSMTPGLVDDCLACLDQVSRWLDAMQTGEERPAGAEASADVIVARFASDGEAPASPSPQSEATSNDWIRELLKRHASSGFAARCALRYAPDTDCFFRGEDPIALLAEVPDILSVEATPAAPWPSLEALDPFGCNLVLTALARCDAAQAARVLEVVRDQVEIFPIGLASEQDEPAKGLTSAARAILQAQILLVGEREPQGARGRASSAARVAKNVARSLGLEEYAATLERETTESGLAAAIERILGEAPAPRSNKAVGAPPIRDEAQRTLRVSADRVDALVHLTGELTIAKNAIGHIANSARDSGSPFAESLNAQHALLERLTSEMQKSVLRLRVLPLRHVFQRFPRLVREMAAKLERPARLVTEGDGTEADRVIVEALHEPLLHVLRNAMDHGVEPAQQRAAAGKPPTATISLRANRQGDDVVVEVEDDGRGVDLVKVRQTAVRRGVVSPVALAAYTDAEVVRLIFSPGFSTASEVSSFSGRGVGMDAVRSAIEGLGGRVFIESREGRGSVVRFVLPFSVMMTSVLTVAVAEQSFGIPIDNVVETVRVARGDILPVGASKAFVRRDRTIPIIDLGEAIGNARQDRGASDATLVVVAVAGRFGAVEVDGLGERMDVMLKPMSGLLAGMTGIAGATLMGDGRVLLILDLPGLVS